MAGASTAHGGAGRARLAAAARRVLRHQPFSVEGAADEPILIVPRSPVGLEAAMARAGFDSCRRQASAVVCAANDATPGSVGKGGVGLLFKDGRMGVVDARDISIHVKAEARLRVLKESGGSIVDTSYEDGHVRKVVTDQRVVEVFPAAAAEPAGPSFR